MFQLESAGMKSFMKELKGGEPGGYHCRNLPVPVRSHGFATKVPGKGKNDKGVHYL